MPCTDLSLRPRRLRSAGKLGLLALAVLTAPLATSDSSSSTSDDSVSPRAGRELLAELEPLISIGPGNVSAVVMDTTGRVSYETNPKQRHTLASVAKIYILVAFLDHVSREGREPSDEERTLMEDMIEASDNVAATELWERAGAGDGLRTYLARKGMLYPDVPTDGSWGDMLASGRDVASFLLYLYQGSLLGERATQTALDLLAGVIDSQAWGVGVARDEPRVGQTHVYFKNGWYPQPQGWIVNSAGIVTGGACEHIIVILTDGHESLDNGKRLVTSVSTLLLQHFGELAAVDACRPSVNRSAVTDVGRLQAPLRGPGALPAAAFSR